MKKVLELRGQVWASLPLLAIIQVAESRSGLLFVLHLRQKINIFVFSFFLVYSNLRPIRFISQ